MVALAVAQRLDLGAGERDAGLDHLADLIIETGLAIIGDDLDAGALSFPPLDVPESSSSSGGHGSR